KASPSLPVRETQLYHCFAPHRQSLRFHAGSGKLSSYQCLGCIFPFPTPIAKAGAPQMSNQNSLPEPAKASPRTSLFSELSLPHPKPRHLLLSRFWLTFYLSLRHTGLASGRESTWDPIERRRNPGRCHGPEL